MEQALNGASRNLFPTQFWLYRQWHGFLGDQVDYHALPLYLPSDNQQHRPPALYKPPHLKRLESLTLEG
ncbi:MAG: hypothetical protein ABI700_12170 [Chloroflexota bacterium]